MGLSEKEIQHLYLRAGFGINPTDLMRKKNKSKEELVDELFKSSKQYDPLFVDTSQLSKSKEMTREERKAFQKLQRETLFELNLRWMKRMAETEAVLRERMVFFFHDHFATRLKNPVANLHLNNILREHALGNFGEMLMQVSKSPAMISFLNNKQNKKDHPNENFAREVMELFTLGRDNGYTETDIKEAARAFTGWSFNKEGQFIFRKKVHDFGEKTVLGNSGNFTGEDIIRILLEQKQTARYLTEKLVDFFIGRAIPTSSLEQFTDVFFNSGYDLTQLVRSILLSSEFFDQQSIGCKIKSPIDLLVGMTRLFHVTYKEPKALLQLQRKLNQLLFFPPNVAGWPGGKSWIDSSTLMLRLKLPSVLLNFGVIEWDEKGNMPEQQLIRTEKRRSKTKERTEKRMQAYPDWNEYEKDIQAQENRLVDYLIQPALSKGAQATLDRSDSVSIKDKTIEILSIPEYQLF